MRLFTGLPIRGSLRFTRYFSGARLCGKSVINTKNEGQSRLDDLNVRTMKSPRSSQNLSKNLRRAFVPHFNLTRYNFRDDLESVLLKCLKVKSCTTVTTAESYDLSKCIALLHSQGFQPVSLIPDEIITFRHHCNGSTGDIMILGQSGSIICWGFDEATVNQNILKLVEDARTNPLNPDEFESEDMDYVELENKLQLESVQLESANHAAVKYLETSLLVGDLILINSTDPGAGLLHKAAFSSGFSRSTKLAVLENAMERHIVETRIITEKVSKGVRLNLKRGDALKSIGRLFLIRGKLNLYSELIETPDLYWSEPQLEKIFKETSKYLDIGPRINILNSKLDYSTEETRALMGVLSEKNSTVLELIIIYLIAFELCFELYHFYERYWLDSKSQLDQKKEHET
ncbi:hypothetical protein ZYGR_0AD04480 [Zygosaccharomyces rouxii]|uniref:ZYRO0G16478p n=2 Tax=Zygosaccharomyces rouxii TaxID=4956 RepID=C5E0Y0_ZYGRC|nr:uncharacterized protein ZYRO0G16478g [Zygosaccharomyces rouxii]KAH9202757.1 hypothetical protein LQ764DRAFT_53752 [Zygosaccharomyces rouxii]GAV51265.1 hypothetical protein ZYGR_0AD04480 [Zygosaccharomyces rouxii]CAR29764.1 ZYRO0G16478p [Zygosaccharomyces rouxii]